jgi:hypothetical protein
MGPAERLFVLETEYHRRVRQAAVPEDENSGLHTSWAIGLGYEGLIARTGHVTTQEVELFAHRLSRKRDPRDIAAACASVIRLLGVAQSA